MKVSEAEVSLFFYPFQFFSDHFSCWIVQSNDEEN